MMHFKIGEKATVFAIEDENAILHINTIREEESVSKKSFCQVYTWMGDVQNWEFWENRGAKCIKVSIERQDK